MLSPKKAFAAPVVVFANVLMLIPVLLLTWFITDIFSLLVFVNVIPSIFILACKLLISPVISPYNSSLFTLVVPGVVIATVGVCYLAIIAEVMVRTLPFAGGAPANTLTTVLVV
jgi:hypothetical protein